MKQVAKGGGGLQPAGGLRWQPRRLIPFKSSSPADYLNVLV